MSAANSASRRSIRLGRPPKGLVPWQGWVMQALSRIASAVGVQLQVDGAQSVTHGANGELSVKIKKAAAGAIGPLVVNEDGTVSYGTILGVEPTIGGDPIHEGPTLTLPATGIRWIVATVTGTPYQTTLSGNTFTHALNDIAVAIAVETVDPAIADGLQGTDEFKFTLAVLEDGTLYQNGTGPITGGVDDLMEGDGTAALNLSYPGT